MRVPAFVHWEGHINPGFSSAIASVLDIVPSVIGMVSSAAKDNETFAKIADKLAQMDGFDLSPVLLDQENNADGSRQVNNTPLSN